MNKGTESPSVFGDVSSLNKFLGGVGELSIDERRQLVNNALVLIDDLFVHLPLKQAMHAIDPVQELKLIRRRIEKMDERTFHNRMIEVFQGLRDLHTNYTLPSPYNGMVAYLPFDIEEYFEGEERKYMVSRVESGVGGHPTFRPGVEVTHWNGMPIERAVEENGKRHAGSNPEANRARGLDRMAVRPLRMSLPPDEEWITITYKAQGGAREVRFHWNLNPPPPGGIADEWSGMEAEDTALYGIDLEGEIARRTRKMVFAPRAMELEKHMLAATQPEAEEGVSQLDPETGEGTSTMPNLFAFRSVATTSGTFGYVRIYSFNTGNPGAFINEFIRIIGLLPQNGLILDVRDNGGGHIHASERLLQLLTDEEITPEPFQLINTELTERLCNKTAWLAPWKKSVELAVETGAIYSQGIPITPPEAANDIGRQYPGPVVLVTSAKCYSATDLFAAGFQDHAIGKILGVDGNTGAGGANVWTWGLLKALDPESFPPLPGGAGFRVAIRRSTRVGERSGMPLEDLGVVPDETHQVTRDDLLHRNRDLIERAGELLANM